MVRFFLMRLTWMIYIFFNVKINSLRWNPLPCQTRTRTIFHENQDIDSSFYLDNTLSYGNGTSQRLHEAKKCKNMLVIDKTN